MIKRDSAGLRFLHLLITEKNWSLLSDHGIRGTDFFGDSELVYAWILEYEKTHKDFPPASLVAEQTGISIPELAARDFVISAMKDAVLGRKIKLTLERAINELQDGSPDHALAVLRDLPEAHCKNRRSFREDGPDRYQEYLKRKELGVRGVDVPWPSLEALIYKWENGTLNSLLAPTNTGKSWACVVLAHHAMMKGEKVVLVTMENSPESFERRLDALAYKIPFDDIRRGRADFRAERIWQERLHNNINGKGDILIFGRQDVDSVSDILQIVSVESPTFVVVDGGYKLSDSSTEGGHAETRKVIDSLHSAAAVTDIPWLVSSQLNPATKSMGGRELGYTARYGKEWIIDPAVSIALMQDDDDLVLNRTKVVMCKMRDSGDVSDKKMEFFIQSDREAMCFDEIPESLEIDVDF